MQKLVYINAALNDKEDKEGALTLIKKYHNGNQEYNTVDSDIYRSIVFTNDGYIVTHGTIYGGHYQLTLNGTTTGSGTSLGSFYAPTSIPSTKSFLKYTGSTWAWEDLYSKSEIDDLISNLQSGMTYKGLVDTNTQIPTNPKNGDFYAVTEDGTIFGSLNVKQGDQIIYNSSGDGKWDVVHSNDVATYLKVAETGPTELTGTGKDGTIIVASKVTNDSKDNILVTYGAIKKYIDSKYTAGAGINISNNKISVTAPSNSSTNGSTTYNPGGIKVQDISSNDLSTILSTDKKYEVKLSNDGFAYVDVPWTTTTYEFTGSGVSVNDNTVTISNTWRPIYAYTKNNLQLASTNTKVLQFGSEFIWDNTGEEKDPSEIHLAWAEIDGENITYKF